MKSESSESPEETAIIGEAERRRAREHPEAAKETVILRATFEGRSLNQAELLALANSALFKSDGTLDENERLRLRKEGIEVELSETIHQPTPFEKKLQFIREAAADAEAEKHHSAHAKICGVCEKNYLELRQLRARVKAAPTCLYCHEAVFDHYPAYHVSCFNRAHPAPPLPKGKA